MSSLPVPIAIHLATVVPAMFLGVVQLARPKGTPLHRGIGRTWVGLMLIASISSFWIQRDGFSWIHGLALFTIFSVLAGVYFARRGKRQAHLGWMTGAFLGSIGAGIGALAGPGRLLHTFAFAA